MHAHSGGVSFSEFFIAETSDESHRHWVNDWQGRCPEARFNLVSKQAMAKLQYGDRAESLIAVGKQPDVALETLDERLSRDAQHSQHRLFLVLDQMEKPGNLGAAMRTADAAGVGAVLLSDPISETWNPNAVRASLGALFRVPIAIGSASQIMRWLNERSIKIYAARVDGKQSLYELTFPSSSAILVGNETDGLGTNWDRPEVSSFQIPMFGAVDSLNVSVSASIVLFEAVRQQRTAS
jgi:RNA methyltransferase, TrmH family